MKVLRRILRANVYKELIIDKWPAFEHQGQSYLPAHLNDLEITFVQGATPANQREVIALSFALDCTASPEVPIRAMMKISQILVAFTILIIARLAFSVSSDTGSHFCYHV